ncbi:hypothetical protein [Kurthia populi]
MLNDTMVMKWHSVGEEMLKLGNYEDYFFQSVTLKDDEQAIVYASIQGRFLVDFIDAFVDLYEQPGTKEIYTYRNNTVKLTRQAQQLIVESEKCGRFVYPFDDGFEQIFIALKRYLTKIKRDNARVALNDEYPQLASRVYWYEQLNCRT